MCAHAAEPDPRNLRWMQCVIRPLVKNHFYRAATDDDARRQQNADVVNLGQRKAEAMALAAKPEEDLEEAQRVTEAVPPEVDAADFADDGIDAMNDHCLRS